MGAAPRAVLTDRNLALLIPRCFPDLRMMLPTVREQRFSRAGSADTRVRRFVRPLILMMLAVLALSAASASSASASPHIVVTPAPAVHVGDAVTVVATGFKPGYRVVTGIQAAGYRGSNSGAIAVGNSQVVDQTGRAVIRFNWPTGYYDGCTAVSCPPLTPWQPDEHAYVYVAVTDPSYDSTYAGSSNLTVATTAAYVALGDSYSSGEGLSPFQSGNSCHRSTRYGYPTLLAGALKLGGLGFADFACTGATTDDFYNPQLGPRGGQMQSAQLGLLYKSVGSSSKVVTLTVGGDDLGFANVLTDCAAAGFADDVSNHHFPGCRNLDGRKVARRLAALRGAGTATNPAGHAVHPLVQVLKGIVARAPHAKIVIGSYPRLFPPASQRRANRGECIIGYYHGRVHGRHVNAPLSISGADIGWIATVGDDLNGAIGHALGQLHNPNVHLARATPLFSGHAIACGRHNDSADHWIQRVSASGPLNNITTNTGAFHPTRAGQANGYERAFRAALGG